MAEMIHAEVQPPQRSGDCIPMGFAIWVAAIAIGGVVLLALCMLPLISSTFLPFLAFQVGLWQWAIVIPLFVGLRRRGWPESAKGLMISACGLLILNALCGGMIFFGSRS